MSIVDQLENSTDIVDLVQKYASLKKAGVNYKALCPFPGHSEKTPSFVVSPSKQLAYCFGCHKWWWALKFIMDVENCEFKDAIEILGNYTWIQVNTNFDKEKSEIKKNLYSLYKDATNYYIQALERNPEIKKYLLDRNINSESIKNFNLWYSDSWVWLYNYLKEKWYEDKLISDSNIFVDIKSRKDKFINRVIFPIQNQRWDIVWYTARIIWSWDPKYLNSPASEFYDKSSILYWLYTARQSITKEDFIIVTEWNADVIALQQAGFINSVAVSGTALTEKHIWIIKRLTHKIYICFDWDNAWEKATKLSLELLKNSWMEVRIITLAKWKDPDDIIKSWWDFQSFIDSALSPIWYYIQKSNFDLSSIEDKKKLLSELLDIIKSYSDNVEKDFYLKEISKKLDINQNIIYDAFNRIRFKNTDSWETKTKSNISSQELAIWYIVLNSDYSKIIWEKIIFKDLVSKDLVEAIKNPQDFLSSINLESKERYRWLSLKIETENKQKTDENINDDIEKLIIAINREVFKRESEKLKEKLNFWDAEVFQKYSELIKIAKKHWIK